MVSFAPTAVIHIILSYIPVRSINVTNVAIKRPLLLEPFLRTPSCLSQLGFWLFI
jgi:hypothetical protein